MSTLPDRADVVVIGAGIVGNSLAYHLADLGWRDIVLLDKGPLPDPGGSTGHASNFIFPVDHSKEITWITLDSMRQYEKFGTLTTSGGIEVAREERRVEEFHRRMASAKSWGIPAELISPERVTELVPFLAKDVIMAGFWTPSVAVVDPLQTGVLMREQAGALGALTVSASTEVLGIETTRGRVSAVRTDRGDIETSTVVIACGVWSPRIAEMAGASIPLTPMVHQMIDVGPIPALAATGSEISYPIVRDMDTLMYERQSGADLEIGSYAHRPILHEPGEIPSIAAAALSPTQLPFTADDFDQQMEQALELF
ncbi:MAG: NAD(P)/FAD-dependent oxidoreductase, partial [Sciscionella sp.]